MSNRDPQIIKSAVAFASKFGFLTQDIFFEFLCPRNRSKKYANWNGLIEEGYFIASKRNPKLLYFTKKGFAAAGPLCVKRRYFYYIKHDTIAARIFLHLNETGRIRRVWTEAELRASPWDAASVLGANDATKLPDLVIELQAANGFIRVAFEVEASRKSRERYDQISFSYLAMKRINMVIFICENEALERQVQKSFNGPLFEQSHKAPATALISDLEDQWLDTDIKYLGRNLKFRELLSRALKLPLDAGQTAGTDAGQSSRQENLNAKEKPNER